MARNRWRNRGRRRQRKPVIFRNRRNPRSNWISLYDIYLNVKEWLYAFSNRVPHGSRLFWRGGRITGHSTRH